MSELQTREQMLQSLKKKAKIPESAVRLKAIELWRDEVGKGNDYPCKYWSIADCFYHYGGGCQGSCSSRTEYIEKARAILQSKEAQTETSEVIDKGSSNG